MILSGFITHTAKSVDFFCPSIIRIILEGKPIKSALRIVRGIQRDAENLVTIVCHFGKRHVLGYVGIFVIRAYILRQKTDGTFFILICCIVSAVILKINGCRSRDKARRYTGVRYRIRCVRVIVVGRIIRRQSIFFVGVVPVSKKNILLCVGFCRRGFLCVDGMVWRGSRIGSVRRGFVRQGWVGRGGVRIGGGSLIFCRFLGFAVIVRNRCCIIYRVSRFCSRLVRSGRGISFIRNRFQVGYNRFLRRLYTLA